MTEGGEINVYNPDKLISEQVTLKTIVDHTNAMALARTGVPDVPSEKPLTHNERMELRFIGLNQIISTQQCLITISRPIVKYNSLQKWIKKQKTDEDKEKNPFEKENNNYTYLIELLEDLDAFEQQIIIARKTKKKEDDFIWERQDHNGELVKELTPNFFKMIKLLEEIYEEINGIMLKNKIISSGISTDEELDYNQKEALAVERIIEA